MHSGYRWTILYDVICVWHALLSRVVVNIQQLSKVKWICTWKRRSCKDIGKEEAEERYGKGSLDLSMWPFHRELALWLPFFPGFLLPPPTSVCTRFSHHLSHPAHHMLFSHLQIPCFPLCLPSTYIPPSGVTFHTTSFLVWHPIKSFSHLGFVNYSHPFANHLPLICIHLSHGRFCPTLPLLSNFLFPLIYPNTYAGCCSSTTHYI